MKIQAPLFGAKGLEILMNKGFAGADWIRDCRCKDISEFGVKVADILGAVFRGIYHIADSPAFKKIDWTETNFIDVVIYGELSTFDFNKLTELVIACHDECVRMSVRAQSAKYLALLFHPRKGREGSMFERHPTMEQAIENWRGIGGNSNVEA